MTNNDNAAARTLTIKRTFDAPVRLVWDAWTSKDHIAQWWAPKGMTTTVVEHDFRVGGKWKYIIPMPNGSEFISLGEYLEIVGLAKIFSTASFIPMTADVELDIRFEDQGDKTGFSFSVIHPTEEYCKQQEQMGFFNGWNTGFDRLNGYLNELGAK
jgi:uncharacterized protein YndB with AHSA1/START domain